MQITDKLAVSIHYILTNSKGEQLDSSRNEDPMVYLHGSGQIIPGLENALTGKKQGEKFKVTIAPEDAYGERRDDMLQTVAMSMFEDMEGEVKEGMQFHADASHGVNVVTVTKVDGDDVTIDGNHPLAGEALTFDVEVVGIRPASKDELSHNHIHGEGCNH
ncbi:MAG: peptidylprolyl isomerase [Methylococcales bacterium]|nr:peptidylprolyl isomerase [Methylococcales bacterium]